LINHEYDLEEYAGFGRRFAAAMIDTVVFGLLAVVLHFILFGNSGLGIIIGSNGFNVQSNSGWAEQLLFISVTVFMWIKFLGTPGKLLLSCHVVDVNTKQPLGLGQAILRYVAYFVSLLPFCLGFFWIIWDKRKQGFHDKIAGTVVIVATQHKQDDESQKTLAQLVDELK